MKRLILIFGFGSFIIGKVNAQCDTTIAFDPTTIHSVFDFEGGTSLSDTLPQPNTNEVRKIYFIHGLGGSLQAWEKAARACQDSTLNIAGFPARKCETIRPNYTYHTYRDRKSVV